MRKNRVIAVAASAALAGFYVNARADSAAWQPTGGTASWIVDSNWLPAAHPDGFGQVAMMNSNLSSIQLVTLDSNSITLGTLDLSDSATTFFGFNIGSGTYVPGAFAANTLVFDNSGAGTGTATLINNTATNNATSFITAPISLNDNLSIVASTGVAGNFTLTGPISDGAFGSRGITATGTTLVGGTVNITGVANTYTGSTVVDNGTLQVTGNLLTSTVGALGNSASAIVIGTATAPAANITLAISTDAVTNNTISRPLDFSGTNTNSNASGTVILAYNGPSAGNSNVLTVSGPITASAKRNMQTTVNHVGEMINFTGPITSAPAVVNGQSWSLGGTSGDTVSGTATYRFGNATNSFTTQLALPDGTVIAAGTVPGNITQGTETTAELAMDSPLGHVANNSAGVQITSAITINGGNGGNIISTNALTATRSVFEETPGTYFGRNLTTGGGSAGATNNNYGTNANTTNGILSEFNGYRFGGLNTTGQINWRGDIALGNVNVGGLTKALPIGNNVALEAASGGTVFFTGRITDSGAYTGPANSSSGQAATTTTRVTINGFRNNPYLDKNGDGIPDTGGAAGTNANDLALGPVSTGIVVLNNPNQSDYWAGTTEVMGGSLIIDNVLGRSSTDTAPTSIGDTVTVDAGATIGGYGTLRSGLPGSTLDVFGTINPSDPTGTTLNGGGVGVNTTTVTRSVFTSEKPINFKAGSSLTIDLNSQNVLNSGSPTGPAADQLHVGNTTGTIISSGFAINLDSVNLATAPLLNVNLNFQPLENQNIKIIDLDGTAGYNGSFAVMVGGSPTYLIPTTNITTGTAFPLTFNGSTYTAVAQFGGSGTDLSLTFFGPSGWKNDADGDYGTSSFWDDGVPTGIYAIANFGNVVTSQHSVNVGGFFNPATINFNASNPGAGYNLSGPGSFGITTLNSIHGVSSIAVGISASGSINVLNDSQLTLSGKISGATKVVVSNTALLTLGNPNASAILVSGNPNNSPADLQAAGLANTYGGGTNVSGGQLTLVSPAAITNFSTLSVGAGALVNAIDHGTNAKNNVFLSTLTLAGTSGAWTGKVDLSNNDLVVQNGIIGRMTDQVKQGFNGGAWNGTGGILSTKAAADTSHLTALGVIQNSVDGTSSGAVLYSPSNSTPNAFDNATAGSATDVLVKYTYFGDTDLNGVVDGSDYSRIDSAFLSGTATGWFNGDFNYDGVVNGSDYTLIDNAYNTQGAQLAAEVATPTAQVAGGSAVPEPTTLSLLGIGAAGLLGRRRRHR